MRSITRSIHWSSSLIVLVALACGAGSAQSPHPAISGTSPRGSIKVSGYWKIDVLNPDGSVASHTEFENSLRNEGGVALAKIIGGTLASRWLYIQLDGSPQPCLNGCRIVPNHPDFTNPPDQSLAAFFFGSSPTLAITPQTQASPHRLVLTGLATIAFSGQIGVVRSMIYSQCPPAPAACDSAAGSVNTPFTEFSLTSPGFSPIAVQAGQIVSVTVTISFS